MEVLEKGANRASGSMQSPSLTPRRSGTRASDASSRRRAITLPSKASISTGYEMNTPRSRSLTRSTAVRDPLGLRRVRFARESQDEDGIESSNVEGG